MSDPIKTSSKGVSGGKTSGRGFIADRYFRLSVTALIFVAFAFGNFEYITGKHRPDPFAWVEPGISWAWWRHPLPEESAEVMPWPVGRYGKFIERNENYSESHLSMIGPGEVNANPTDGQAWYTA